MPAFLRQKTKRHSCLVFAFCLLPFVLSWSLSLPCLDLALSLPFILSLSLSLSYPLILSLAFFFSYPSRSISVVSCGVLAVVGKKGDCAALKEQRYRFAGLGLRVRVRDRVTG